jgi:phospholipid/cholesterol/gamma-HCH transport system ATP-binding protein
MEGVRKAFGNNVVLAGLNLRVCEGENLAILGKSGTGKSVILKIITGLLPVDDGEVCLWGQSVRNLNEDDWRPLRRRIGMLYQSGALFDSMTVFHNVAFPAQERNINNEMEIRQIVEERLEWVGLPGTGDLAPSQLSGGMRRRVALARTIAGNPEFMLYDEPTTGLDPVTGRRISRLMRDLDKKLRSTSILVTHDIGCARTVSSRWAYLSHGRVVAEGAPEEILATQDPEVRDFFISPDVAWNLPEVPTNP